MLQAYQGQPERVQVLLQLVGRPRLHGEDDAVRRERGAGVPQRADRVTEVVQGVEHGDHVVRPPGEVCRPAGGEAHIRQTGSLPGPNGSADGVLVVVDPQE